MTPRLVKPVRPGDVIATPLDNTLPANDADFFLTGNAELTQRDQSKLIGFGIPFSWTHPRSAERSHQCGRGQELRGSLWSS